MESPESRTFAQFGGALLLISLALPWFALSLAGFGSHGFRIWSFDKGALVLVAAYGLLALSNIQLASRDSMALIYLIIGVLMTGAFVYKIWISPPGSAPIGDVAGVGSGLSANDVLKSVGIELKPSYGAYVACVGSLLFTAGAFMEFRASGQAKSMPVAAPPQGYAPQQAQPAQPVSPAQRYTPPVAPPTHAPDPFAPPPAAAAPQAAAAQAGARQIPPDPFAPRPPAA
jgi:hypothetical protein